MSFSTSIVIVDDEEVVTRTIRSFLQLETDYDVHTFQSPARALEHLERQRADLILSDFLMPDMNGLEFLSEVKRRWPRTVRVMLTGYADKENAIRAINEVELFQYLEKPWDNDQLVMVIKNGLRQQALDVRLRSKIMELDRTLLERNTIAREQAVIKEELAVARRVQEAMLPQEFPHIQGFRCGALYRPALEVGGDFYDVARIDERRVAAFVADATGHGIQAALTTTLIKAGFTEISRVVSDPRDILLQMNDMIHRSLPTGMFVAASTAIVDSEAATVRVIGGGGPNPLCIRRDGSVEQISSNGLPLGVVETAVYPDADEGTVELEPGDAVLLYTDGLTEVENGEGAQFGECDLVQALQELVGEGVKPVDLSRALLERARTYASAEHAWDDVTALVIERIPTP